MSRWAAELAAVLKAGQTGTGAETVFHIATVVRTSPFTITIQGQSIIRNLHVSPALTWRAELSPAELENIFQYDGPSTPAWLPFLKEFYKQCITKSGDQVMVLQIGNDFYVLGVAA